MATTFTYAAAFRCIGPACEDDCCHGWTIPLDRATYTQYKRFPTDPLASLASEYVTISDTRAHNNAYARIQLTPDGRCPFFTAERLCGIQQEYGHPLLSATCSIYPRVLNQVGEALEGSLSLSCPEAARNVLLNPNFLEVHGDLHSGAFRTDNTYRLGHHAPGTLYKPYNSFHAIRRLVIELIRDRRRPLWQRLVLTGSLCQRLNAVGSSDEEATIPAMLDEYSEIIAHDWLHDELAALPTDLRTRVGMIMRLSGDRARDRSAGKRFHDLYLAFIEGLSTSGDDLENFRAGDRLYYRPLLEQLPFLCENYLLNTIIETLFPFGRVGSADFTPRSIFDEYLLFAMQFAWIDTLLTGVAARFQKSFSTAHIVWTIQAWSRAVQHDPRVMATALDHLRARGMDNLQGISILLRT